jgi:hypothetical protein
MKLPPTPTAKPHETEQIKTVSFNKESRKILKVNNIKNQPHS